MITRTALGLATILVLAGCSDSTVTPPWGDAPPLDDRRPAHVEIVSAARLDAGDDWEDVTAFYRNTGGPGAFIVQVRGVPNVPNGDELDFGESEPFFVAPEWSGGGEWRVMTEATGRVRHLVVLTRDEGSVIYRETDRHTFPE